MMRREPSNQRYSRAKRSISAPLSLSRAISRIMTWALIESRINKMQEKAKKSGSTFAPSVCCNLSFISVQGYNARGRHLVRTFFAWCNPRLKKHPKTGTIQLLAPIFTRQTPISDRKYRFHTENAAEKALKCGKP